MILKELETFDNKNLSIYQPPADVLELTKRVQEVYERGNKNITRAWPELNNRSVIDDENRGKKIFNAFVDEEVENPAEAWKWPGTRSMARNRALGMYAHLTSGFMFPMVGAQNEDDEEDMAVGDAMRDLLIWMGDNSNYRSSFLQVVMGVLTSPVIFLSAEYAEVLQNVREKTGKGYKVKEVLDEELSGFQANVYGASEVLITNPYQQNIQKQTCIIKQRYLDYYDAKKKYGKHSNWDSVKRGINSILNVEKGLFYDVYDEENSDMVKEVIIEWRGLDLEIPYLNGIYFGNDNIEWNPIKHRDNFNQPKYNVVPFGYYRISEHFFYYKSLMNALSWDNSLIDAMYQNYMNGEFIFRNPPVAIMGEDDLDTNVFFPGAQTTFKNADTKVQTLLPQRQDNMLEALQVVENSMKEASISDTQMGQLPEPSQKAFSVAKSDQTSKILLKGVANSFAESIILYGRLMIDIAIRHLSSAEIEEISNTVKNLKYKQFILPQEIGGKRITKVLKFDKNLLGKEMTENEKKERELELFEEAGAGENKSIVLINPQLAARMKYLIRIDAEEMFSQGKEYTQNLMLRLYSLLRADPLINAETLVRKLSYSLLKSEADDILLNKGEIEQMQMMTQASQSNQAVLPQQNNLSKVV